jgi:hypothetical protein
LKQGEVSPLIEGKDRFYVMRLKEVSTGNEQILRSPQNALIKDQILNQKRDRLLKEWLEGIRRASKIQVEESLLKG